MALTHVEQSSILWSGASSLPGPRQAGEPLKLAAWRSTLQPAANLRPARLEVWALGSQPRGDGSLPSRATICERSPAAGGSTLKTCSGPVRIRPLAPCSRSPIGRGNRLRGGPVSVRIAPGVPVCSGGPIGRGAALRTRMLRVRISPGVPVCMDGQTGGRRSPVGNGLAPQGVGFECSAIRQFGE